MSARTYIRFMSLLTSLIENENTGNINELATRLKVSKEYILLLIDELVDLGAEIGYNQLKETYFFRHRFNFYEMFFQDDLMHKNSLPDKKK